MLIAAHRRRTGSALAPSTPVATRTYVHAASDGTQTDIYVNGQDRWHYINGGARRMHLPYVPTAIAGRYALTFYDLSTRRGYRRFHDDYMLEDKHPAWGPWSVKHTYPYRAQFRISGKVWHR